MKLSTALALLAALGLAVIPSSSARALPPPPSAPFTLWNFLGIPQGFNKIRDATTNRRGNRPGLERKPPMKALADPQNLMSPNPAIAKAAEIKTQEDMAPQKIKAIKYLASVGCGCYAGVKEALLAALDDCTEEVRYQTVLAIEDAAGAQCETCGQGCCCDEELTTKLSQIAYEKTDKCCWLEPSERVREAAKRAMCACCPNQGAPEDIQVTPVQGGDETVPQEPTPPAAEAIPPSARRTTPGASMIVTGTRVHDHTRSTTESEAIVSDQGEIEEIVTVEFGGSAPATARTAANPNSPSGRRVVTPATTRKPAAMNQKSEPAKRPVSPTGQSSRRSAVERGLAAPAPATTKAPAVQQASAQQPAKPVETKASTPAKQSASSRPQAAPQTPNPSVTMLKALPWLETNKQPNGTDAAAGAAPSAPTSQASTTQAPPVVAFRTVLD